MDNLQDSIFPYLLKEYLIYFIIFLAATVLVLFMTLVIHKLHIERREGQKRRYMYAYRDGLARYISSNIPLARPPQSDLQFRAFADVCIDIIEEGPPSAREKIKALLQELAAVEHFKISASSSSWTRRFYAVETLGFFMIDGLKGFFGEVLSRDSSPEVKAKALWAVSLIADKDDIGSVTRLLSTEISNSSKFNVFIYSNMIESCRRRGQAASVTDFLESLAGDRVVNAILKRDLIEACGVSGLQEAAGLIKRYYYAHSQDTLMKIACLRGLGSLGSLDAGTAVSGLTDINWRVRAVAARSAHTAEDAVISELRKLLYDHAYIVRINAARTLSRLGAAGMSILKGEVSSRDRFVRETARFIIEEVEGRCSTA